jgi:hypothetical protein
MVGLARVAIVGLFGLTTMVSLVQALETGPVLLVSPL